MKLTSILNEITVNPPIDRKKAFNEMLNLDEYLLTFMISHDSLDEFIQGWGYTSLEELLIDNFNINNPQSYIPIINNYYKAIRPGDIISIKGNITPIEGCKNAITLVRDEGFGEDEYIPVALKF